MVSTVVFRFMYHNSIQKLQKIMAHQALLVLWDFYFLLKFYLFFTGSIKLDTFLNLIFLVFIIIPAPEKFLSHRTFRYSRNILNIVFALLILWYESWLPPLLGAWAFLNEQGMPSYVYIYSFIRGFFSMSLIIVSIVLLVISFFVKKYKLATTAVLVILIITVPLIPGIFYRPLKTSATMEIQEVEAVEKEPAKYLESFYSTEAERVIMFKQPDSAIAPFDIVVVHVCSMSWDDLKEIGLTREDPFFKQFDYLFTNFNTATGYSGPAVHRLLQANCGQMSHSGIYKEELPKACLLFEGLSSIGYEPYISMDHDGKYGNYLRDMKKKGLGNAKIIPNEDSPVSAIFFDGKTELHKDFAVLKKWFDARQGSRSERAALYYNSVLLHSGAHWAGERRWWRRDTYDQFKDVSAVLLRDLKKFIELLKSSNRNTVLVFVPEHGRALTGNSLQPANLRDIPLPKITKVPVGVKLIGLKFNNATVQQQIISKPTSYFALSWMLSKFIENSPFGNTAISSEDMAFKVPKTEFVAEHEGRVVIELGGSYLFYGKDKKWITLTPDQLK